MAVNLDKPQGWKSDIVKSVDMYNDWFMNFAPKAFRETRIKATADVKKAFKATNNLLNVSPETLRKWPHVLPTLRMSTCPPIAVDRLVGLSGVTKSLVGNLEIGKLPARISDADLQQGLVKIGKIIETMADPDIFVWLERKAAATNEEVHRAATIVADRLCGSIANPIIRNAQEQRQLAAIATTWLEQRGFKKLPAKSKLTFLTMPPGTYSFRMNVPVNAATGSDRKVNIPVDAVVMFKDATKGDLPLLIEAKSAGDFTNTNKRRKEEAQKMNQLSATYGDKVKYILFLCGYFDSGYLGYDAAESIDWVWEHRIDDLREFRL